MMKSFRTKRIREIVLGLITTVCCFSAIAQAATPNPGGTEAPKRGAAAGNTYSMGDFETINTTNGNLMFNFTLGSLPSGRGNEAASITLRYDSKLWDLSSEKAWDYEDTDTIAPFDDITTIKRGEGGWRLTSSGDYRLEVEDRMSLYDSQYEMQCRYPNNGGPTPYWEEMTYRYKTKVVFPDGSKHELIPALHFDVKGDRYFNVTLDGEQKNCGNYSVWAARPTYYSVDGSYLRMEHNGTHWVLYFSDGKKVDGISTSGNSGVFDRNGNRIHDATDEFGRSITVSYSNGDTLVTTKGVNGDDIVWTIKWKYVYVTKSYQSCFDTHACAPDNLRRWLFDPLHVVDKIIQPQQMGGGAYTFKYNASETIINPPNLSHGWGEVSEVELPSGAKINYTYALDGVNGPETMWVDDTRQIIKNYPTSKTLSYYEKHDGVTSSTLTTETWGYFINSGGSSTTAPDGSVSGTAFGSLDPMYIGGPPPWDSGLTFQTVSGDGTLVDSIWTQNHPFPCTGGWSCYGAPFANPDMSKAYNPYVKSTLTSIKDASGNWSLTAIQDFTYDKNGNVVEVKEYDWIPYSLITRSQGRVTSLPSCISANGQAPCNVPKRITRTAFYNAAPASTTYTDGNSYHLKAGPRMLNLEQSIEVLDGANNPRSRSEMTYDFTSYSTNTKGGNLTSTKTWDSTKGNGTLDTEVNGSKLLSSNFISTGTTYNAYGMPLTSTDANGNVTQITYGNVITPTGTVSDLYPTHTVAAYGTSVARTSSAVYDFHSGLATSSTDVDNNLTNTTEYDRFGRPTKVITAVGTLLEAWTQTTYNDTGRFIVVRSDLAIKGDGKKVATQFFDPVGRVRLMTTLEDALTQDPTNEAHGIKVQTRYKSVSGQNGGNYTLVSNPFRAASSSAASNEPTMGWKVDFDNSSGKLSTSESFSGVALPAPWGSNSSTTGLSKEEEDANTTTTTDESDKKRRIVTDGLGRMIRVDEPNGSNNLGNITSPNQATNYVYDTLGNLTDIVQGGQARTFTYSTLSRLLSATNPESGTFTYTYDNNGNLSTKTDARSVSTAYTYDALNRATFRNYSDSTPDITYTYGESVGNQVPFAKGKLTKVSSSISESLITAYDEQERVVGSRQTIEGRPFDFVYTYDLADNLTSQTLPSNKIVTYDYDNSGDLTSVGKQIGSGTFNYANSFEYSAHGQVQRMRFGNGKWENTHFNGALQITQVSLGHSSTDTGLWKTEYEYGDWDNGNLISQKNNGNLVRQTVTVPTIGGVSGFTAVQTYTYDSLDRLKSAVEKVSNTEKWKQTFLHDRFGNRNFDPANTSLQSVESNVAKITNPEVLASNNKFKTDQDNDSQDDYLYDASGNLTRDALGRQFTYDAENRQISAIGSGLSMGYSYDGNGKRVKSYNAQTDQTTIFIYDADNDLAAEYTINVPEPQNPTISYTTQDALGSPRVITDSAGAIKARRDFLPFGEELYSGIGDRNTNQKFAPNGDTIRQKFTGYQRDTETGLDFAQSRYYSPMQGRFTSPDEFKGGPDELYDFEENASGNPTFYADLTNPQSLNKYQYTYNNPYKYTDPSGHCPPLIAAIGIGIGVACIMNAMADPIGPRPKQTLLEGVGDVIGIIPGGKAPGTIITGFIKGVFTKGAGQMVKQAPKVAANQASKTGKKTYQTYTKTNGKTGKVYSGRTSGKSTPQKNIANRDRRHHKSKDGYGPAKLDKSSANKDAIRGREQQLIDKHKAEGRSGNDINGIAPNNKNRDKYMDAAKKEFGKEQ